jgi:hypothetical protein
MGTGRAVWRTGPNQSLTADHGGLRLVVRAPDHGRQAVRFYVTRRHAGGQRTLIGSGTEPDVRAAMVAAEQVAVQFAGRE